MSVDELKHAIVTADPEIDNDRLIAYVAWAFSTTTDGVRDANPVENSVIVERLANGNVARKGKKQ